jgi:hypothetical protein
MAPDEVIKASGGQAAPVTDHTAPHGALNDLDNTELLLKAPYEAGRYKFTASFYFNKADHRLSAIELVLDKDQLSPLGVELLNSLTQKYGKPIKEQDTPLLRRAEWQTDSESVTFLCLGGMGKPLGILVAYAPINTQENEKL